MTSATSAAGVPDLRKVLIETVIARRAALQRISADVDAGPRGAVRADYAGEISGARGPPSPRREDGRPGRDAGTAHG